METTPYYVLRQRICMEITFRIEGGSKTQRTLLADGRMGKGASSSVPN
jgi:hypothetical protein